MLQPADIYCVHIFSTFETMHLICDSLEKRHISLDTPWKNQCFLGSSMVRLHITLDVLGETMHHLGISAEKQHIVFGSSLERPTLYIFSRTQISPSDVCTVLGAEDSEVVTKSLW